MRSHLAGLFLAVLPLALGMPSLAADQGYPSRPIRLVVGYPPGGGIDLVARPVAQMLSASLGQPVIVDNRPGANGIIGTDLVAKSAPDGYTLLLGDSSSLTINPAVYKSVPYRTVEDFDPVCLLVTTSSVLVTHPSLRVSTMRDLIELGKKSSVDYGSAGNGSISQLIMESIKSSTGTKFVHVPYKGAQLFTAIAAGEVKVTAGSLLGVKPFIDSGQVVPIAVTSKQRAPTLPNVPTVSDSGIPGFEAVNWFGVLAPRGTPKEIVSRLNVELVRIVNSPEMKAKFAFGGADVVGSSPAEFAEAIQLDLKRWGKVARESGTKVD